MTLSLPAVAQQPPNCPPDGWFCEEVDVEPPLEAAPPADDEGETEAPPAPPPPPRKKRKRGHAPPLPPPLPPPPPPTVVVTPRAPAPARPPVVVYQPSPHSPPPQIIIVAPGAQPPPPPPPQRVVRVTARPLVKVAKPKAQKPTRWGLNLRFEGVGFSKEDGADHDAGMGGVGLSLRYRPIPAFAFDLGLDLLGGKDFNGMKRVEMPLSLSGMLFVNPKSRVQFYFIGGVDWSHAKVESDGPHPLLAGEPEDNGYSAEYSYLGGHGGIGLEFRLSRRFALNVDGIGFVRKRTDDGPLPEFYDPETGRTTNTSGGGLFRGGLTFYW